MKRTSPVLTLLLMILLSMCFSREGQAKKKAKLPTAQQKSKPVETTTRASKIDLSTREQELLAEINFARSNPAQYLRYLEDFKRNFKGKELTFSDGQFLITNEGVAPLEEAIEFVRSAKPLPPLEIRLGLVMAAKDHLTDMIKTGKSGHKGSDGSNAEDRISRYGTWDDSVGENIVYFSKKAREDVISMIIDDGVKSRGHRKNIFKQSFHVIGLSVSPPLKSGTLSVITFAGDFRDSLPSGNKEPSPARKY